MNKKCPFCGGGKLEALCVEEDGLWTVGCLQCKCTGPLAKIDPTDYDTYEEIDSAGEDAAFGAWNKDRHVEAATKRDCKECDQFELGVGHSLCHMCSSNYKDQFSPKGE